MDWSSSKSIGSSALLSSSWTTASNRICGKASPRTLWCWSCLTALATAFRLGSAAATSKARKTAPTAASCMLCWNSLTSATNSAYSSRPASPSSAICRSSSHGTPLSQRPRKSSAAGSAPSWRRSLPERCRSSTGSSSACRLRAVVMIAAFSKTWERLMRSKELRMACAVGKLASMGIPLHDSGLGAHSSLDASWQSAWAKRIHGSLSICCAEGRDFGSLCKQSATKFFASTEMGLHISVGMNTKRALRKERWLFKEVTPSERSKGVWPESRKYDNTPNAQMSALPSTGPSSCSGARQQRPRLKSLKSGGLRALACDNSHRDCSAETSARPQLAVAAESLPLALTTDDRRFGGRLRPCLLARPKSIILRVMSRTELSGLTGDSKSQFSGRMSLCTTSCSCKWATALAICLMSTATVRSLKLSLFSLMFVRLPPWHSSMMRYTLTGSSKVSCSLHTCG
mmetsp:Transcript_9329/g.26247  ORF Transcript_9329/g.26247 Transcript_9329/m.26247 type:complete len:457 (+) Transcript_9329:222-1592(+)